MPRIRDMWPIALVHDPSMSTRALASGGAITRSLAVAGECGGTAHPLRRAHLEGDHERRALLPPLALVNGRAPRSHTRSRSPGQPA